LNEGAAPEIDRGLCGECGGGGVTSERLVMLICSGSSFPRVARWPCGRSLCVPGTQRRSR